jgi:hypothetical protein
VILCARCFKRPSDLHEGQELFNYADTKNRPICSMECRLHPETPVERAARTGIALMNADLMFHMLLSCGREDDDSFKLVQARRMLYADILQELSKLPELEAVAL